MVVDAANDIQATASALAELDVFLSFATVAADNRYVMPEIDADSEIVIRDGRHPVVEKFVSDAYFVPNDTMLDTSKNRLMLITGPNMAGKSTYMRQVALITLMAQIGSFVPAASAKISIVDKLFTRVGASDDLASGQSTFMLEMTEVSYILKNATNRSLIIYDEVGRGTSTYDGMSIARAVVEYTAKKIGAKTLFATHYHELTSLEGETEGVVNYNIAAKKRGNDVVFLRKIVKGAADDSYGIEVAHLAGVPETVVNRAKQILQGLAETDFRPTVKSKKEDDNVSFESLCEARVIDRLKNLDINTLTPYEAITILYELKKELD
jgi:DNA mismatch repair protein MutS